MGTLTNMANPRLDNLIKQIDMSTLDTNPIEEQEGDVLNTENTDETPKRKKRVIITLILIAIAAIVVIFTIYMFSYGNGGTSAEKLGEDVESVAKGDTIKLPKEGGFTHKFKNIVNNAEFLYPIYNNVALIKTDGKFAFFNISGDRVDKNVFDYVDKANTKYCLRQKDKSGFANLDGTGLVLDSYAIFLDAIDGYDGGVYDGGYILTYNNKKEYSTILNNDNKEIFTTQYRIGYNNCYVYDDNILVKCTNYSDDDSYVEYYCYAINLKTFEKVPLDYDRCWIYDYGEGLLPCRYNNFFNDIYGYMDINGNTIISPSFYSAGRFSEGLAPVKYNSNSNYCFINKSGEVEFELRYGYVPHSFNDGVAVIENERRYGIEYERMYGLIDKYGNEIIYPTNSYVISDFKDGISIVSTHSYDSSNKRYGVIDKTGKEILSCKYRKVNPVSEGLGRYMNEEDKYGYYNINGPVIECKFSNAGEFHEGYAWVCVNEKYGYINKYGEIAIPCIYDSTENFSSGYAVVTKNGKYGYIDVNGNSTFE